MTRRLRNGLIAAALGGLLLAGTANAAPITLTVGRTPAGRPVAPNFVGLALEYSTLPQWEPTAAPPANSYYAVPVDPVLDQLIAHLDPGGQPIVRIGGLSTDRVWWPVPGMAKPLGVTYTLTRGWINATRALAVGSDARFMLGLNLEADSTRLASVEAKALVDGIGRQSVAALQIGNEPNLYTSLAWYRRLAGRNLPWYATTGVPVFSRPSNYGPSQYLAEVRRFLPVLPAGVAVSGPETSGPQWTTPFSALLGHSAVSILTSHAYGTSQCITDPNSPAFPSVADQLSLGASHGLLSGLQQFVALAHRHKGGTYRVDEMGPDSCNGTPGVSNTMVGALWEVDSLFSLAAAGVDGVNLHTFPGNLNALFDLTEHAGRWSAVAHPLYYGALLFAQAAPAGSRLLTVGGQHPSALRAWATAGRGDVTRVVLLNDRVRGALTVRIGFGSGPAVASLERLLGPGGVSATKVTLAGARVTGSGALSALMPAGVAAVHGSYTVTLPAGSAAILTL